MWGPLRQVLSHPLLFPEEPHAPHVAAARHQFSARLGRLTIAGWLPLEATFEEPSLAAFAATYTGLTSLTYTSCNCASIPPSPPRSAAPTYAIFNNSLQLVMRAVQAAMHRLQCLSSTSDCKPLLAGRLPLLAGPQAL